MNNYSSHASMDQLTYRGEAIRFSIWALKLFRYEENTQHCNEIISSVLSGQPNRAWFAARELPGHRIRRKMDVYLRLLMTMTSENIQMIDSETLELARWFVRALPDEEQSEVRDEILALLLTNQTDWADFKLADLDCPMIRDKMRGYLRTLSVA
jgi:hypothetical protein